MKFRPVSLAVLAIGILCFLTGPAPAFSSLEQDAGDQAHPNILTRHGGAYYFPALSEYVNQLGARLAEQTDEPADAWTFTILDTPTAMAFAQPGGYVYVSRGLLALANSEAELAAALAHPMAQLIGGHVRPTSPPPVQPDDYVTEGALLDGLIGVPIEDAAPVPLVGRNTGDIPVPDLEAEIAALDLAVGMLDGAGYPTRAALDLVNRLQVHDALSRTLDRTARVEMLGRTQQDRATIADALTRTVQARPGLSGADPGTDDYKFMIQGLLFGDSPAQGLVRDGAFLHPILRFAFDLPEGFIAHIDAASVAARGPGGAVMLLDTTDQAGSRLESYIRDDWAPDLTRRVSSGYIYDLQSLDIGGFEAASAFQPYADDAGPKVAQLVVIRTDDRVYRFRCIAPAEDIEASLAMEAAVRSFRPLSSTAASRYTPHWLQIHEVRRGESLNLFAASVPLRDGAEARFRDLNGYDGTRVPVVGDLVKLVME